MHVQIHWKTIFHSLNTAKRVRTMRLCTILPQKKHRLSRIELLKASIELDGDQCKGRSHVVEWIDIEIWGRGEGFFVCLLVYENGYIHTRCRELLLCLGVHTMLSKFTKTHVNNVELNARCPPVSWSPNLSQFSRVSSSKLRVGNVHKKQDTHKPCNLWYSQSYLRWFSALLLLMLL